MKKAIVLSAGFLGLGIIRSLGKEGIKSIVIYENEYEVGVHSKYCIEKVKIGSFLEKKNILNVLLENKERWGGLLIIPGSDESLIALSYYKKILEKHYLTSVADYSIITKIINKKHMYDVEMQAKIPVPRMFFPKSIKDIDKLKGQLMFPCLIKPFERHYFFPIFNIKLFRIENFSELKEKLELCINKNIDVFVTEMIPGGDKNMYEYCCYVAKNGEITNEFVFRKIRQAPPLFGVTRVGMSAENNELIQLGRAFMGKLKGFFGPAHVEFKYDDREGKYKFIEVNGRVTLSASLSTRCGINYPYILYKEYVDSELIKKENYEKNIYWINFYQELVNALKKETYSDIRDLFAPYLSKKIFALGSLADPFPGMVYYFLKAKSFFKRLFRIRSGNEKANRAA